MSDLTRHEYTPLVSAFIERIEYSYMQYRGKRVTEIITIWFTNGSQIEYLAPEAEFIAMRDADSIGKYYHANIKNKYQGKKIK